MAAPETPRLLSSWKEIASFFGRDVRTVQRWQREGLPVHRRPGAGRSGVFAYQSELEDWLQGRQPRADAADDQRVPPSPAPPAPVERKPRVAGVFLIAAASLTVAVLGLMWVAAARSAPDGRETVLATSPDPLTLPRWGDADGNGRQDLVVTLNSVDARSSVLLFLDAGQRACEADALECATVRIAGPPQCALHAAQVGDLNADGFDDVAVSCVLMPPASYQGTGPSFVVWGREVWPRTLQLPRDAGVAISEARGHDTRLGGCLGPQGSPDVNGDGISDLLLSAVESGDADRGAAGELYVFLGRRDWASALDIREADITFRGSRTGEGLGAQCAAADFTGDGRQDLAIAADERRLWNLLGGAGRTYLLENPGTWAGRLDLAETPAMRVDGTRPMTYRRQVALADVDGDGRAEMVVTEPLQGDDTRYRGSIGVWRGGPLTPGVTTIDRADTVIHGAPGGHLGTSISLADLDGDGVDELFAAESLTGTLFAVSLAARARGPIDLSPAASLARFDPVGKDDGVESLLAVRPGGIAHVTRARNGRWSLLLRDPFEGLVMDVRPGSPDDVFLKPGVGVIAIEAHHPRAEPVPETVRAAGARPFTHKFDDVNGDGVPDLLLFFQTSDLQLPAGDSTLVLTARDRAGRYLRGTSPVRVIQTSAAR